MLKMGGRRMFKKLKKDIKVTRTLKTEKITLRILLISGAFALFISGLLEYLGKLLIYNSVQETIHIEYLVNIALGFAASAFVSFVSLVFQFFHRKNERILDVISRLKNIYYHYEDVYLSISKNKGSEDYLYEERLAKKVDKLIKEIDYEIIAYEKSEITSSVVEKINKTLKNDITNNLSTIAYFCSTLLLLSKVRQNKTDDVTDPIQLLQKDVVTKKAEIENYQLLVDIIDQNYSFSQFSKLYQALLDPVNIAVGFIAGQTTELKENIDNNYNTNVVSTMNIKINCGIMKIMKKYSDSYIQEKIKFHKNYTKKITDLTEKLRGKNINISSFLDKIDEIHKAEESDKLEEAERLYEQLKSEIENLL